MLFEVKIFLNVRIQVFEFTPIICEPITVMKHFLDHALSPHFHRDRRFFSRIFVRHSCHLFDRSAIERNNLSINMKAAPSFDKLRRDF